MRNGKLETDSAPSPIFLIGLTDRVAEKMESSLPAPTGWLVVDLQFGLSSPTLTSLEILSRDEEYEFVIDIYWREDEQIGQRFELLSKTKDLTVNWDLHQRFMAFYSHDRFVELQREAQQTTAELLAKLVMDSRPT